MIIARVINGVQIMSFYVAEPSKGPNITLISNVTSTSMKVAWGNLTQDDANGVITEYKVCYKASQNQTDIDCKLSKEINASQAREVTLDGLNEATIYNVAVQASTAQGFGPFGAVMTRKTLEDCKRCVLLYYFRYI